jgi:hypothetical protein
MKHPSSLSFGNEQSAFAGATITVQRKGDIGGEFSLDFGKFICYGL